MVWRRFFPDEDSIRTRFGADTVVLLEKLDEHGIPDGDREQLEMFLMARDTDDANTAAIVDPNTAVEPDHAPEYDYAT